MEKEKEYTVTWDDINPLDKSIDPLTTVDQMKRELEELNSKINKRESEKAEAEKQKAEAEAEEKRLNEIKAEAEKMVEDQKSTI